MATVQDAREILCSINKKIESGLNQEDIAISLANPSPENCARCEYRPNCTPYKFKLPSMIEDMGPVDVFGQVEGTASFPNGSSAITIATISGIKRVKGLDSRPGRHPALVLLEKGTPIGVYNLRAIREKQELTQGPATTIYVEDVEAP
jgi:hypothetical protein